MRGRSAFSLSQGSEGSLLWAVAALHHTGVPAPKGKKGEQAVADPRIVHRCNVGNDNQTQTCLPTETKGCGLTAGLPAGPEPVHPRSPAPQEAAWTSHEPPIRLPNSLSQLNAARLTLGREPQERAHYLQQIGTPPGEGDAERGGWQAPSPPGSVREGSEPPCKNPPSVPAARTLPALRAPGGTPHHHHPPPRGAGWEHKQARAALARAPQFCLRCAASICCRINTR